MSNRLVRFREYMARFDAAATPEHAIERGFYVERAGRSVASEIVARVELRPTSTHLVVGGVGSGKTTQVLVAHERLSQVKDLIARYVDVGAQHDLSRLAPGALVVLAGLDPSAFVRFDLNLPDQPNQEEGLRSHVHPSTDDFAAPSPFMGPLEVLDILLYDLRVKRTAPRT